MGCVNGRCEWEVGIGGGDGRVKSRCEWAVWITDSRRVKG